MNDEEPMNDEDNEDDEATDNQERTTRKKCGPKKGSKFNSDKAKDMNDWYMACATYKGGKHKDHLRTCGPKFTATLSEAQVFGRMLKKYQANKLVASANKKMRASE